MSNVFTPCNVHNQYISKNNVHTPHKQIHTKQTNKQINKQTNSSVQKQYTLTDKYMQHLCFSLITYDMYVNLLHLPLSEFRLVWMLDHVKGLDLLELFDINENYASDLQKPKCMHFKLPAGFPFSLISHSIVLVDLNEFPLIFQKVQHSHSRHQKTTSNLIRINLKGILSSMKYGH